MLSQENDQTTSPETGVAQVNTVTQIGKVVGTATHFVTFSRSEAKSLLDNKMRNRQIGKDAVNKYKKLMESGNWIESNPAAPILITKEGMLGGGQHRLTAFLASEKTEMTFPVAYNATKEAVSLQDTNKNRNFANRVEMASDAPLPTFDMLTSKTVIAISKILTAAKNSSYAKSAKCLPEGTEPEVGHTLFEYEETLKKVENHFHAGASTPMYKIAPMVAAMATAYKKDPDPNHARLNTILNSLNDANLVTVKDPYYKEIGIIYDLYKERGKGSNPAMQHSLYIRTLKELMP